jgi:hypothetical protein
MKRPEQVRKKHRARVAVEKALKRGALLRPTNCSRCNRIPPPTKDGRAPIQGHHHLGYDRPLDVEWLCVRCHGQETPKFKLTVTHCPKGHPYSPENTYLGATRGERRCRECARERDRLRPCGWERSKHAAN